MTHSLAMTPATSLTWPEETYSDTGHPELYPEYTIPLLTHLLNMVNKSLVGHFEINKKEISCSLPAEGLPVSPKELVTFLEPIVKEHTYALQCQLRIIQLCLHLHLRMVLMLMLLAACHCACAHTEGRLTTNTKCRETIKMTGQS